MVGREGLENRRIVWITSQGSVRPHSSDGNRKPRGSIRAVLRANEGEGGHMGRGREAEVMPSTGRAIVRLKPART